MASPLPRNSPWPLAEAAFGAHLMEPRVSGHTFVSSRLGLVWYGLVWSGRAPVHYAARVWQLRWCGFLSEGAFLNGATVSTAFSGIGAFEQSLEILRSYLCDGSSGSLPGARTLFAVERDHDCQNELQPAEAR